MSFSLSFFYLGLFLAVWMVLLVLVDKVVWVAGIIQFEQLAVFAFCAIMSKCLQSLTTLPLCSAAAVASDFTVALRKNLRQSDFERNIS